MVSDGFFFFPDIDASFATVHLAGTWVFRAGSCSYLLGSYTAFRSLRRRNQGTPTVYAGVLMYTIGAFCYIAGGILSELKSDGSAQVQFCYHHLDVL